MTDRSFDRIAEAFMADGPDVLADRVFEAAFEEVHRTHQRRVLVRLPWRFPTMNTYAKLGVVAVAVIAVGFLGLNFLGSNGAGGVGAPSASPSPTVAPTPSPTVAPTPGPTGPPLTEQFTSETHGYSISYPGTWSTKVATTPWTTGFVDFASPSGDALYEPSNPGNIWLALASQPLGDRTPAEWEADVWQYLLNDDPAAASCSSEAQPVTIDGAAGVIGCGLALVTDGGRGYFIQSYVSSDVPINAEIYDEAWFASVLATMELHPEDAVDAIESPAPS